MADPVSYTPTYSFSGYQNVNPSKPLPAPRVDDELAQIGNSLNTLVAAVKDVRRSDGGLKNGSVTIDALSPSLSIGFTARGAWAAGTAYVPGDGVVYGPGFYKAKVAHTAATGNRPDVSPATWVYLWSTVDTLGAMSVATYDPNGRVADVFNRTNHTGTQAISTVANLQTTLNAKIPLAGATMDAGADLYTLNGASNAGLLGHKRTDGSIGYNQYVSDSASEMRFVTYGSDGVTAVNTLTMSTATAGLMSLNGAQVITDTVFNTALALKANLAVMNTALALKADASAVPTYEQGSFTPILTFGVGSTGITYGGQVGRYTKIGRMVYIEGSITLTAKGSSTGAAAIGGLPYTIAVNSAANVIALSSFTSLVAGLQGIFVAASNVISVRTPNTAGTTGATDANFTATSVLYFSGSYSI